MFTFLLILQSLVAASMVAVILMQRSEGGGLGVGGSPSGLMSARGAANFLTRATTVLAVLFVLLSIVLATLAVGASSGREIDTSLQRGAVPAPADPLSVDPLAPPAAAPAAPPAGAPASPAAPGQAPVDPLAPPAEG